MTNNRATDKPGRGGIITLRASRRAACRQAESALLDRCHFVLSGDAFQRLTSVLDSQPKDNPGLRRLLQTKAAWDR
jgi:uncharacterized protein (DUF1778 family)